MKNGGVSFFWERLRLVITGLTAATLATTSNGPLKQQAASNATAETRDQATDENDGKTKR